LPQVYGFVQQSGGRLALDSEVGAGTLVTLMLPRSSHRPVVPVDATGPSTFGSDDGPRRQVLLVEDDAEVASLTQEMLIHLGFGVIHAASPSAALGALANGRSVDVVFSDIMMSGGMSGLDLAREIRRRHPHLRIVLTTGYAEAAAKMDSDLPLLLKPYTLEAVAKALGRQLH